MTYPRFFVKGVDLAKCLVTQDEFGRYWLKGGALARFVLSEFNKSHAGYVLKSGGSHKPYPKENAIDFSVLGDMSSDQSMKLNSKLYIKGYKVPYGLEWVWGNHHLITYHVKTEWKVGGRVPAGKFMCTVMTPAENKSSGRFDKAYPGGFPSHLHFGTNSSGSYEKTTVRQFILAKPAPKPPVEVPEVEATVVIPETLYKSLVRENAETKQALTASNSLVTSKNLEIEKEQAKTQTEQDLKHLYAEGLKNLSELLGSTYDINTEWDLQRYRYDEVLQKMRELAAKEALSGLIRRYVEKVRELLNKFKKK